MDFVLDFIKLSYKPQTIGNNFPKTAGNTETGTPGFFNKKKKLSVSSKKASLGSDFSVIEVQLTTHTA